MQLGPGPGSGVQGRHCAGMTGMCSVGRVNVFSFGGDVFSFQPNVFTLAGQVFSEELRGELGVQRWQQLCAAARAQAARIGRLECPGGRQTSMELSGYHH